MFLRLISEAPAPASLRQENRSILYDYRVLFYHEFMPTDSFYSLTRDQVIITWREPLKSFEDGSSALKGTWSRLSHDRSLPRWQGLVLLKN